ncbi:MAG: hypothetical protein F2663_10030 [Actinobacteria bacterium]|uniref:Unannotated protein n=1 Tax=freshwater metagenome TaxID=449393 RepID=A0A6J6QI08_9ZZZZ|nr:hypothetical protein [Actinomycetota bacterium]
MRVVDEIRLAQHAGPKRFSTVVQLIESPDGERFVRFSYSTDGVGRRGPVTLRPKDVERLRAALALRPEFQAALDLGVAGGGVGE